MSAPDFLPVTILLRKRPRHVLELLNDAAPAFIRPRPGAIEQRGWKHRLVEPLPLNLVPRIRDHLQRGERIRHDFVVCHGASFGQTARNSRVEQSGLQLAADLVSTVEERDVAPRELAVMRRPIAPEIVDDPVCFGLIICEPKGAHRKARLVPGRLGRSILEDRFIDGDQASGKVEYRRRATPVVVQMDHALVVDLEVGGERAENFWISAGP